MSISALGTRVPTIRPMNVSQRPKIQSPVLFSGGEQGLYATNSAEFGAAIFQYLQPDATLYHISKLTPKRLRQLGDIKAIIFDLDDTLIPFFKGQLSNDTVRSLKRLQKAGYQMGVLTNNIQPAYCQQVRERLAEVGLAMPFIEDARKPAAFGFEAMRNHFNLKPSQMVVVGDGLLSDIAGAKRMGFKAIRARWHTKNNLLSWEPFLSLWDSAAILMNALRVLLYTRRKPLLTNVNQNAT